ncbi:MAG: inositol monophosphatase [Rhodobacterales bacterium]|nr:inositol monophosphatase [Rhodobacterales bacterium]
MTPDDLDGLTAILAESGSQALGFFDTLHQREVEAKSPGDLVSDADRAVEQILRQRLTAAFPDCSILGEEYGGTLTARTWAIDPIDGTSNFLSGLPFWTVSLGLLQDGQPVAGGIIAPALGLSALGTPGQPLRTTGFTPGSRPGNPPCIGIGRNPRWPAADRHAVEAAIEAAGLAPRLIGSCALSLLMVATGRLAGYIEPRVGGLWDCAGGLALCRAAGLPTAFRVHSDGTVDVLAGGVFDLVQGAQGLAGLRPRTEG